MARLGDLLASLLRRRTSESDPLPDAALLDRFARSRDQAAFELLVWRHGPMVLAACRRVLKNDHAAEDAFQAAFLVLARKAGGVRGAAAGWLHRVAVRVCLRMKRRTPPLALDAEPAAPTDADVAEAAERSAILDEEVSRLPEFLRLPVILCYLQGHSTEQAAAQLGIPRGTVLSRLANAKKRLAVRLTARGVTAAVAAVAVAELSADAGRVVAEAAVAFVHGTNTTGVPVQLALETLSMTTRTTVTAAVGLMLLAGLGTGVGFVAAQGQGAKPTPTSAEAKRPVPEAATADEKTKADEKERAGGMERARERLTKMLAEVEKELADTRGVDLDTLRQRARTLEQRRAEVISRVIAEQAGEPVELQEELTRAEQRLAMARIAPVPADVLAEAVKLHPKVAEMQKKYSAKQEELVAKKLPRDDPGRKKLEAEGNELAKELQAVKKEVGPEVEAYLRTPGVVEAQKARASVERRLQQFSVRRSLGRQEFETLDKELDELTRKLANVEPMAEELAWKKEKRKRLKQELFELDLQELGVGRK